MKINYIKTKRSAKKSFKSGDSVKCGEGSTRKYPIISIENDYYWIIIIVFILCHNYRAHQNRQEKIFLFILECLCRIYKLIIFQCMKYCNITPIYLCFIWLSPWLKTLQRSEKTVMKPIKCEKIYWRNNLTLTVTGKKIFKKYLFCLS